MGVVANRPRTRRGHPQRAGTPRSRTRFTTRVERQAPPVSDSEFVIVLVVCLVVAVGGFFTSIRLVRNVRAKAEATKAVSSAQPSAEHTDER